MNTTHTRPDGHDDGVRRILGVPVSLSGLTDARARLRGFEPENPDLLVPRTVGAGWDLNIGAVAVRLGLIRPDDSLPDLAGHIPPTVTAALRTAPVLGGAVVTVAGVRAAMAHDRLPSNWGITLRPTRWARGPAAMAAPVLLSAGAGIWARLSSRRGDEGAAEVDVTSSAQALGLQATALLLIAAATRHAENPQASRLLPAAGLIAAPAVTTGVLVGTVRSALNNLDRTLRATRGAEGQ